MPRSHNRNNQACSHSSSHAFHFTSLIHYKEYNINQAFNLAKQENSVTRSESRSSQEPSLRREEYPRLGEIATRMLGGSRMARLGEPLSLERDNPSPKGEVPRLG